MPNCNTEDVKIVCGGTVVNSKLSSNWKSDWLRFCFTSYAYVVERNITNPACKQRPYAVKSAVTSTVVHSSKSLGLTHI